MEITYENVYFSFINLKKKWKNDEITNVHSLQLDPKIIQIFQEFGILIVENNSCFFLNPSEKNIENIDLYYYFSRRHNLHKILHQNLHTRFLIHLILFKINSYLSPEKLIQQIQSKLNNQSSINSLQKLNITNQEIIDAHNILLSSGLISYDYCQHNLLYNDNGNNVLIKDKWLFNNQRINQPDFLYKLVLNFLTNSL